MKPDLLKYLGCPGCRSSLTLREIEVEVDQPGAGREVITGSLDCTGCGAQFDVTEGIPRMHVVATSQRR